MQKGTCNGKAINKNMEFMVQSMERLAELAKEFNIDLQEQQLQQFQKYYECLIEKNKVMNLTAITEKEDVIFKHFLDSLSICKIVEFQTATDSSELQKKEQEKKIRLNKKCRILDMGTGAGFPGIPIKLAFPELEMVLADSLRKRVLFLDEVIEALSLTNITTVHGRAEELARKEIYREKFQLCVSRAVAKLSVLLEYCLPFVAVGGYFISYKSTEIKEELEESKKAISVLGGKLERSSSFLLPQSEIGRNLIVIKKVKETGKKYPRTAGKPSKEPIH